MSFWTISDWQRHVYDVACSKGWHRSKKPNLWKMLGNIHGEVSEAWEEARKSSFEPKKIYYVDGKPEGLPIELADIVIRVMDTCEALGIDLEDAIDAKDQYNQTRPYRHGGKRA